MIGLLILMIGFAAFVAFVALSMRFGVDSRPESNDPRRSPSPVGIS